MGLDTIFDFGLPLEAQRAAVHDFINGGAAVLHEPQTSATPEQACVFYDGNRMLGGWIRFR